jgi:sporulation protein YlmC with PRC-barrel domain
MENADDRSDNPYTQLEGYKLYDASGEEVGKIDDTVYDAPSDVLKYVVVSGHIVPAERIEVHVERQSVSVPYDAKTIDSAPHIAHFSGAFDEAVHEHYR